MKICFEKTEAINISWLFCKRREYMLGYPEYLTDHDLNKFIKYIDERFLGVSIHRCNDYYATINFKNKEDIYYFKLLISKGWIEI